jgi:acyl-CoA dehydrogenase
MKPLVAGEVRSCFSMTEPEVSGADPTGLRTRAVRDGDEWVINGHKWFTSGAIGATFAIVMAVSDPEAEQYRRMSQIIVPLDMPGVNIVRAVPVMGETRGAHCEIRYEDVRVPVTNVLGEPGDGFRIAQKRLGPGRIHHCMRWLGQMQRAFELLCRRALSRQRRWRRSRRYRTGSRTRRRRSRPRGCSRCTPRPRSTRATRRASRSR